MSFFRATKRRAIGVGALAAALLIACSASAWSPTAWASTASSIVRFHGYRLTVPFSWPVFDLARHPATCVRFNRHAIYLGVPSANQSCPAHAAGRTEAILVTPLSPAVTAVTAAATTAAAGQVRLLRSAGSSSTFAVPAAGVAVTATWDRSRSLVSRIVGRRLTESTLVVAKAASAIQPARAARPAPRRGARAIPAEAVYGGLGFDACAAPSTSTMSAWGASPYRAINIYIGGRNSACAQPNLNSTWASGEVSAGWQLIPTYVGLQGLGSCGGSCATMSQTPSQATAEGIAAATDAVNQAQALGIPAGNPIYDDMEQYSQTTSNTAAVLAFLSGWTAQLHAEGYLSGVYSSASSGITDLVNAAGTGYTEPDDIWIAHWNNQQTTSDAYVPSSDWADHQRIHQYDGGHDETYGGVTLNIDGDFLDGATADAAPLIPDGTFVQVAGTPAIYRVAGGAPLWVSTWAAFGAQQPFIQISAQQFSALRPYPANGTFLTTTSGSVYRVAGGVPISVTNWGIFGAPQPSITVDQWDVSNLANPLSHLRSAPLDGTVVEGLPSGAYWSFSGGYRTATGSTSAAVGVDDAGLLTFAQAPLTGGVGGPPQPHQAAPKCMAPRLKHLSLVQARGALRKAHCRVGTVRRPHHWSRFHLLHVFGQSTRPNSRHPSGYQVNLRLI